MKPSASLSGAGRRGRQGFSLVELLVVVSIMTMLAAPSLLNLSLQRGQDFTKQVYDLQGILSLARSAAMAQNTFVWTGLAEATVDGRPSLLVVAYASRNGMNDTAAANLSPVMKRRFLSGVGLTAASPLLSGLDAAGTDLSATSAHWALPPQTVAGASVPVTRAILFSPTGEAFLAAAPLAYIEIGLEPLHGAGGDARNVAALQVSGITSQTQVFRN